MGLFSLFGGSEKNVVLIDTVSINKANGAKGNVSPRTQLQLLRRLARFAQREKLDVVAILSGRPLNKAPAGKKFEGIEVLYSGSDGAHNKFLIKTHKARRGLMIMDNREVEEDVMQRGLRVLRVSTFRKAFDIGGDQNDDQDRGGNSAGRERRPRRRSQQNNSTNHNNNNSNDQKSSRPPQKKERSQEDTINELIDLVD